MSLIIYATKLMNVYCGFQLTWKTCEAFKSNDYNSDHNDQLLIKWFLLYFFIQCEGMISLFTELIPFGFLFHFAFKTYLMMPHSKWHSYIYTLFEKLEMDEFTGKYIVYISQGIKFIMVKILSIFEIYVDIIRVDDLPEIEQKLEAINNKIVTKKSSIEIRQSKMRIRKSTEQGKQIYQQSKLLRVQASVQVNKKYEDFTIIFNQETCQIQFQNPNSGDIIYTKTLLLIDLNEDKCIKATYDHNDGNLSIIKLKRPEDISQWLTPVIEILISKAEQENNSQMIINQK